MSLTNKKDRKELSIAGNNLGGSGGWVYMYRACMAKDMYHLPPQCVKAKP